MAISNIKNSDRKEIFDLQNMLYVISLYESGSPSVIPDGIFGVRTQEAITNFQTQNQIEQSGVADYNTWQKIANRYNEVLDIQNVSTSIFGHSLDRDLKTGDIHPVIYPVQILFCKMSREFPEYIECTVNGVFDSNTKDNVIRFQTVNRIPNHGNIDRVTLNRMEDYHTAFHR